MPELINNAPKLDKRKDQLKIGKTSQKIVDMINRMINSKVENRPSGRKTKPIEPYAKRVFQNVAKRKRFELQSSCYFAKVRFSSKYSQTEIEKSKVAICYQKIIVEQFRTFDFSDSLFDAESSGTKTSVYIRVEVLYWGAIEIQ